MSYLVRLVRQVAALDGPGESRLAALAGRQHGVVARWQLLELGYTRDVVSSMIAAGYLHRLHRGVYAVGHRSLTLKGRWMAAVLACGPDAVLSHRSAAALWELRPAPSGAVDVSDPGRTRGGRDGIRIHRVRSLDPADHGAIDRIPVTNIWRTLLDYAEVAQRQQLRLALDAGDRRELLDGRQLEAMLARTRGRRGLKPLRAAVAQLQGPAPWTQSELERAFHALIREAGLPEPQVNVVVEGQLVDFLWPDERLVVEVDGYEFHKTRAKFESDRRMDAILQRADMRVLRATRSRIEHEPQQLLSDVVSLLDRGRGRAAYP